jgi:hypothetical protein
MTSQGASHFKAQKCLISKQIRQLGSGLRFLFGDGVGGLE